MATQTSVESHERTRGHRSPRNSKRRQAALAGLGVVCAIAGTYFLLLCAPMATAPPATTPPVASANPVEQPIPPADKASYDVPADHPRLLSIPKLAVSARILPVNKTRAGSIDAPASIHDAGWYTKSALPGHTGVMFVDGHVSGPTQPGIFKHLTSLIAGDSVVIERGDHTQISYTVQRIESRPVNQIAMSQLLDGDDTDPPSLILMTCGGRFDHTSQQYSNRIIVFASETVAQLNR